MEEADENLTNTAMEAVLETGEKEPVNSGSILTKGTKDLTEKHKYMKLELEGMR